MAKRPSSREQSTDGSEIKKLLEGLHKIIQTTNAQSKEQISVNRELLKLMAVLQSGFAQNEEDARRLIDDVRDGLELNDDYAKKWLKKMGATDKQIDEIIDKFRDLEKIDMDLIDNAEDYLDLLDKRYDVLDDTFDLTKRLLTNHDAITKAIRASKDVAMKLAGPMGDVDAILEKMVAKKVDVSTMFDGITESTGRITDTINSIHDDISSLINNVGGSIVDIDLRFSPLTDDLDKEISSILESIDVEKKARLDGLIDYFNVNKKLQNQMSRSIAASMTGMELKFDIDTGEITTATGILKRGTDEYQAMIRQLDEIADKNNITDKMKGDFEKIVELIGKTTSITDDEQQKLNALLTPLDLATKMMLKQIQSAQIESEMSVQQLQAAKDRYRLMGTYLNQLQTAESIVLKIGSGFDNLNAIMPTGIGEFLGLSKVSSQLIESHKKGVQSFADELEKGVSHADALRSYYKELSPALSSALSPMTILVTSTVLLFNFVSNIVDKYKEMSSQMKTSLMQSKQLYETQLDILTSQKNQFATMEDIQEAQAAMIGSSGKVFDLTDKAAKELTISLIETGKAFGYGTESAVKMHKIFARMGADDTLAENLQQSLGLMSEAIGISPQIVSQDLIDSAEELSIYFAGMPTKAAQAAIKVRQMGMSLKQAGHIAQKMLNLEGFMTDMYELQAMTGGGIDFSGAFDKGLMGDVVGMTEDIMNNIGSTARLNEMDYLTRMKIANTLDMSVEELTKSVKLHEDMQGMLPEEQKYLQANLDKMGDISNASKEEIRNRMQQLQSTDRLNVAWDKIKGTLIKALLPAVEIIADAISAISPILDGLVGVMKIFGGLMKIVIPIVKGLLFPFKIIGSVLEKITSATDSFAGSLAGVNKILSGIGDVAYFVGAAIGTIFAVRHIGTFISFVVGGFGTILKAATGIVPMLRGSISGIFETLTGISTKSVAATASAVQSTTDIAANAANTTKNTTKAAIADIAATATNATAQVKSVVESTIQSTNVAVGGASTAIAPMTATANAAISEVGGVASNAIAQVKTTSDSVSSAVSGMSSVGASAVIPVKTASAQVITEVASTATDAVKQVDAATGQMGASIEKVKTKTKGGFFGSVRSKAIFKGIGAIGATTFATLAVQAGTSFFKAGKEGEESMANMASASIPMFGTAFAMLGPMMGDALGQGIERFVRKQLEGKLEDKFEPVLKKVRKGFASIEIPATKAIEKVGERGTGIFGRMFDSVKKMAPKPFGAVTGALTKVTSKFGKGGGIFARVFGTVPEIPVADVLQSTDAISGTIDQVQGALPEKKQVQTESIDTQVNQKKEVIEQTVKPIDDTKVEAPKKIEPVKTESIDTKPMESKAKESTGRIQKIFSSISDAIKSTWESIKSSVKDIIQFGIDTVKQLATGIVDVVKILAKGLQDVSGTLFNILKSASKTLKSILGDIVDFAAQSMKTLTSAIGQSIKNILKGIGDGLSSFKTSAIKGAAALLVLSGALWVSSKAIQNFGETKWEDVAKAGVVLGGLTVAGLALGSASPAMIIGAAALAGVGAALMVTGIALEKFDGIDWSSIGKAGAAIVGFGAAATGFAAIAPMILVGSATLAVASISIAAFGGAMMILSESISIVDPTPLDNLTGSISELVKVSASEILGISAAITTLGASMVAFSAMRLGSGMMDSFSGLFANDLLKDLERFALLANPLQIAANAIGTLSSSLSELSTVMESVDLTKIDDLKNIGKISVEQKMTEQMQGRMPDIQAQPRESEIKVIPFQMPAPKVQQPRKEAVAQNVKIVDTKESMIPESGVKKVTAMPMQHSTMSGQNKNNPESMDIYNRPELAVKELKFLLQDAVKLLEVIAKKNLTVNMDGYKVNKLMKTQTNNI